MTWAQPLVLASATFSGPPAVPITVAPRCAAHWQAIWPTPPAAAWNRITCSGPTLKVRRRRYCAVMPLSMEAAAISSLTPAGIFTRCRASITRSVE